MITELLDLPSPLNEKFSGSKNGTDLIDKLEGLEREGKADLVTVFFETLYRPDSEAALMKSSQFVLGRLEVYFFSFCDRNGFGFGGNAGLLNEVYNVKQASERYLLYSPYVSGNNVDSLFLDFVKKQTVSEWMDNGRYLAGMLCESVRLEALKRLEKNKKAAFEQHLVQAQKIFDLYTLVAEWTIDDQGFLALIGYLISERPLKDRLKYLSELRLIEDEVLKIALKSDEIADVQENLKRWKQEMDVDVIFSTTQRQKELKAMIAIIIDEWPPSKPLPLPVRSTLPKQLEPYDEPEVFFNSLAMRCAVLSEEDNKHWTLLSTINIPDKYLRFFIFREDENENLYGQILSEFEQDRTKFSISQKCNIYQTLHDNTPKKTSPRNSMNVMGSPPK